MDTECLTLYNPLWEPVLMRKPQNSVIDSDSLKSKFLLLTICFLMKYGQNEVVKIWPFHPKKAVIKNWSNWKIKTIFLTSSSSWFQICKKIWKKFIFWPVITTYTNSWLTNKQLWYIFIFSFQFDGNVQKEIQEVVSLLQEKCGTEVRNSFLLLVNSSCSSL